MTGKFTIEFISAAAVRAIKTFAQVALSMITIGATISEINWGMLLSVSAVAAIYSVLTSITTGLPEVGTDGTLKVDTSGETDNYMLDLSGVTFDELQKKTVVKLRVSSKKG